VFCFEYNTHQTKAKMTTETRIFIGESGTAAFDGYAAFRI
jgi:hypothetical protein